MLNRHVLLLALLATVVFCGPGAVVAQQDGYRIVLRSRHAEATPAKCRTAQTGGGWILVEQPEADTVVVTMGGSAVVGSTFHGSSARVNFDLVQDLDIVPTRAGLAPPRIGMIGRVVGTLQMTGVDDCVHGCRNFGCAQQGPALATLSLGEAELLSLEVEPSSVTCSQKRSIDHQSGPYETVGAASTTGMEPYRLTASFSLSANQGKGVFNRRYSVVDFDPQPQLDAFWADALKPFRAVPRNDFGFQLVVRVVEDTAAPESESKRR